LVTEIPQNCANEGDVNVFGVVRGIRAFMPILPE